MTRELKPCGTPAAYARHLRRGEEACAQCKAAMKDRAAAYRAEVAALRQQLPPLVRQRRAVLAEAVGHGSYGGIAGGS